jgi:hypothetical protein
MVDLLFDELRRGRLPLGIQSDANGFRLELSRGSIRRVMVSAEDDALVVKIDDHTSCRFSLSDYDFARETMRDWYVVTDVMRFLQDLSAAAAKSGSDT